MCLIRHSAGRTRQDHAQRGQKNEAQQTAQEPGPDEKRRGCGWTSPQCCNRQQLGVTTTDQSASEQQCADDKDRRCASGGKPARRQSEFWRDREIKRPEDAQRQDQPIRDDQSAEILERGHRHQTGEPGDRHKVYRERRSHGAFRLMRKV